MFVKSVVLPECFLYPIQDAAFTNVRDLLSASSRLLSPLVVRYQHMLKT